MIPRGKQGVSMTTFNSVHETGCIECGAKESYHGYCDKCWLTIGSQKLASEANKMHEEVLRDEKKSKEIWRCA